MLAVSNAVGYLRADAHSVVSSVMHLRGHSAGVGFVACLNAAIGSIAFVCEN
jgi:hypothetical protein